MDAAAPDEVALIEGHRLPSPPASLAPGEEAVVAVWREGDEAALLSIAFDPDDDDPLTQLVEIFRWRDGAWRSASAGGTDWPVAYGERSSTDMPELTGFSVGTLAHGRFLCSGIAPAGMTRVHIPVADERVKEATADAVTGAFLVAMQGG